LAITIRIGGKTKRGKEEFFHNLGGEKKRKKDGKSASSGPEGGGGRGSPDGSLLPEGVALKSSLSLKEEKEKEILPRVRGVFLYFLRRKREYLQ